MIEQGSRYQESPVLICPTADGNAVRYLGRRWPADPVPAPTGDTVLVRAGDRPDLLAVRACGDPLAFWRIAEVNQILDPVSLTHRVGTRLVMPVADTTFTVGA